MVKIGDVGVSEQRVVETAPVKNEENKSETKSTSTSVKKAKSRGHSLAIEDLQQNKKDSTDELDLFKNNIYIVFVECETAGNVGFLARTMANFGLKNLVLINPTTLTQEAYYQATHGKYIVENALIYSSLDEFYQSKKIDFKIATTGVAGGSYNLSRIPLKPEQLGETINVNSKIAILFGREGNGLTNKEIEDCDISVSIPTDPAYHVLNVSHAAAIIFYELFKNKHEYPVEDLVESTGVEKEYLINDMVDLINSLDIPDHKKKNGIKTFRNIINRAFITGREAHTLKGILRRLKNKMG